MHALPAWRSGMVAGSSCAPCECVLIVCPCTPGVVLEWLQGGCSGLSYQMDFADSEGVQEDDYIIEEYEGLKLVIDPKSLLYLFGMQCDYSNSLVGGGFKVGTWVQNLNRLSRG
jgi:iron-sulfur cluster assembly accessory protein